MTDTTARPATADETLAVLRGLADRHIAALAVGDDVEADSIILDIDELLDRMGRA